MDEIDCPEEIGTMSHVVMHRGRNDNSRPRFFEQRSPFFGIPFLAGELRDEILVTELVRRAELLRVPFGRTATRSHSNRHDPRAASSGEGWYQTLAERRLTRKG